MKKILCLFLAIAVCAALCGCGNDRTDHGLMDGDMDLLPDVSPMISPDREDGQVQDQDGIIGNGDGHSSVNGGIQNEVSPSPNPDGGKTSPMPTTAPSASPNP